MEPICPDCERTPPKAEAILEFDRLPVNPKGDVYVSLSMLKLLQVEIVCGYCGAMLRDPLEPGEWTTYPISTIQTGPYMVRVGEL